ncbi:MAG: ApaG domain [Lactobacillaceae bacterium]|jgi:ApaG protein|nr:ApaG domain [Lactobacillaceae bacterium]
MQNKDYFFSQTDDISISACPMLVENLGAASVWGYYFCFENNSDKKIQLVGKNWNITDSLGNVFHDGSAGFKGELPELEPGEYFEFTSEVPLSSQEAVFYGSCKIILNDEVLDVKMPTFCMSGDKNSQVVYN